jgi:hypothetical protein
VNRACDAYPLEMLANAVLGRESLNSPTPIKASHVDEVEPRRKNPRTSFSNAAGLSIDIHGSVHEVKESLGQTLVTDHHAQLAMRSDLFDDL